MNAFAVLLFSLMSLINTSSASRFYHRGGGSAWHSVWPGNPHYRAPSCAPTPPPLTVSDILGSLLATAREVTSSVATQPPYQIVARKNDHLVAIDLPGVAKSDVEISLEGNVLSISAERRFPRFADDASSGSGSGSSGSAIDASSSVDTSSSVDAGSSIEDPGQKQENGDETAETAADLPAASVRRYKRTFELGSDIDLAAISASMEDGVLLLTLPKLPEAQRSRIEISGGGSGLGGKEGSKGVSDEIEVTAEPVAEEPTPKDPEAESATHISISASR